MQRARLWKMFPLLLGVLFGLSLSATAKKPPKITQTGIDAYDGKNWCGLTIGVSTLSDVKKLYRVQRCEPKTRYYFVQDHETVRIGAAFSGVGDTAVLQLLAFYQPSLGPKLAVIDAIAGEKGQSYYEPDRYEDWQFVAYPNKGLLVSVLHEGGIENVQLIMLCQPAALPSVTAHLSSTPSPIKHIDDPHAGEDKRMEFGITDISFNLIGLRIKDMVREKASLIGELQRANAGGAMKYVPGAAGHYNLIITGDFDAKRGGTISVSASIDGKCPYGPVSAEGRSIQILQRPRENGGDNVPLMNSAAYTQALYQAMQQAESALQKTMDAQGPPPVWSYREQSWNCIIEVLRGYAAGGGKP